MDKRQVLHSLEEIPLHMDTVRVKMEPQDEGEADELYMDIDIGPVKIEGEIDDNSDLEPESSQSTDMNGNIRNHSKKLRPHKCQHCPKAFGLKGSLTRHMGSHTGERRFKCEQCQKAFLLKHHLAAHLRIHTGERPFECQHCPKTFARKEGLKRHIRAKHL